MSTAFFLSIGTLLCVLSLSSADQPPAPQTISSASKKFYISPEKDYGQGVSRNYNLFRIIYLIRFINLNQYSVLYPIVVGNLGRCSHILPKTWKSHSVDRGHGSTQQSR
jgi:hypothetical protein